MSQINKAPPFLELSKSTIQNFDTAELDIENVLSIWTGLTKCSKFIKNGKRLENISWRIVNRNLVYSNQIRSVASSRNLDYRNFSDEQFNDIGVPLPGSYKPLKNKLNDGDFMSLLSIVADQGFIEKPQLTRRRSSNKNLKNMLLRPRNKSTENVKNHSESNLVRPPNFRKSSSSKNLKKPNYQKSKSTADLKTIEPVHTEYEQPNPALSFGVINSNNSVPKPLQRSDTSTSIVRGFDPNSVSKSSLKSPTASSQAKPQHHAQAKSLFGNHNKQRQQESKQEQQQLHPQYEQHQPPQISKNKTPSLFGNDQAVPSAQPSLFGNASRAKSPLSRVEDGHAARKPASTSLFHPQPQHQHQHPSQPRPQSQPQQQPEQQTHQPLQQQIHQKAQKTRTLFDQVGISPDIKKSSSAKTKRNNVLNNLGMTTLVHSHKLNQSSNKDKSMFFIESSPSPTDSTSRLHSRPISPLVPEQHSPHAPFYPDSKTSNNYSPIKPKASEPHKDSYQGKEHESRESSTRSLKSKRNKSLFGEPSKPLNFSSNSSISDESDWSSVSESDDEEYDNKIRKQWEHMYFERKEAKPQIKRSLLSGLFLNNLNDQHHIDDANNSQRNHQYNNTSLHLVPVHNHQPSNASPITSAKHHDHQEPLKSELSSSMQSITQVIHRHRNGSNHENSALELSTSKPKTISSTSNVSVPGIVNETAAPTASTTNDALLKSKLTDSSASISNLISKSALNLTNYFSSHRRNSFSSIVSDKTRVKFKHESNAPPTASTILPTALSTHMFLPNAHQRAKSRLAAVFETDSSHTSASTTRKNSESESGIQSGHIPLDTQVISKPPLKSPTLPIPKSTVNTKMIKRDDASKFTTSRKLSPTTTRRQMLATELSDSLRKSILWDRKNGLYPTSKSVKPLVVTKSTSNEDGDDEDDDEEGEDDATHADDEEDDDHIMVEQWTKKEGTLDGKKKKSIKEKENEWLEEEATDFYNKGW